MCKYKKDKRYTYIGKASVGWDLSTLQRDYDTNDRLKYVACKHGCFEVKSMYGNQADWEYDNDCGEKDIMEIMGLKPKVEKTPFEKLMEALKKTSI